MSAIGQAVASKVTRTVEEQTIGLAKQLLTVALMPTTLPVLPMPPRSADAKVIAGAAALANPKNSVGGDGKPVDALPKSKAITNGKSDSYTAATGESPAKAASSGATPDSNSPDKSSGLIPPCPGEQPDLKNTSDGWCLDDESSGHGKEKGYVQYRSYDTGTQGGQQCVYDSNGRIVADVQDMGTIDKVGMSSRESELGKCQTDFGKKIDHGLQDYLPYAADEKKYNDVQECLRDRGVPSGDAGSGNYRGGISDADLARESLGCEREVTCKPYGNGPCPAPAPTPTPIKK